MLVATCLATAGLVSQNPQLQQQLRHHLLPIQVSYHSYTTHSTVPRPGHTATRLYSTTPRQRNKHERDVMYVCVQEHLPQQLQTLISRLGRQDILFTAEQLRHYTSDNPAGGGKIYMAILGEVFDVSAKPEFYGELFLPRVVNCMGGGPTARTPQMLRREQTLSGATGLVATSTQLAALLSLCCRGPTARLSCCCPCRS